MPPYPRTPSPLSPTHDTEIILNWYIKQQSFDLDNKKYNAGHTCILSCQDFGETCKN